MRTTAPLRETYPPGQTGVATEAQGTRVRARAPLQVRRKVYPRSATLMLLPPPPPLRKTQPTETRWHLHNRRSRRRCGRRAVTANAVTVRRRSTPRCPPPFEPLSTPTPQFSVRPSSFNGQNWRGGLATGWTMYGVLCRLSRTVHAKYTYSTRPPECNESSTAGRGCGAHKVRVRHSVYKMGEIYVRIETLSRAAQY